MRFEKVCHGFNRDFSGFLIGEVKYPGRNTAESYAFQTVFRSQFQTGVVAGGQQLPVTPGHTPLNDWANGVQDVSAGQIVGRGDLGLPGRFLISLPVHQFIAVYPQLDTAFAVDDVINVGMKSAETAPHAAVRRINDGIYS